MDTLTSTKSTPTTGTTPVAGTSSRPAATSAASATTGTDVTASSPSAAPVAPSTRDSASLSGEQANEENASTSSFDMNALLTSWDTPEPSTPPVAASAPLAATAQPDVARTVNGIPLSASEVSRMEQDRKESFGDNKGDANAAIRNMGNLVSLTEQPFYDAHNLDPKDAASQQLYSNALLTAHAATRYDFMALHPSDDVINTSEPMGIIPDAQVDPVFQDTMVQGMLTGFPNHADVTNSDGTVTPDVNFNHMLVGMWAEQVAGAPLAQDTERLNPGADGIGPVSTGAQWLGAQAMTGDLAETIVKGLTATSPDQMPEGGGDHTGISAGNSPALWSLFQADPAAGMAAFASDPATYSKDGAENGGVLGVGTLGHHADEALQAGINTVRPVYNAAVDWTSELMTSIWGPKVDLNAPPANAASTQFPLAGPTVLDSILSQDPSEGTRPLGLDDPLSPTSPFSPNTLFGSNNDSFTPSSPFDTRNDPFAPVGHNQGTNVQNPNWLTGPSPFSVSAGLPEPVWTQQDIADAFAPPDFLQPNYNPFKDDPFGLDDDPLAPFTVSGPSDYSPSSVFGQNTNPFDAPDPWKDFGGSLDSFQNSIDTSFSNSFGGMDSGFGSSSSPSGGFGGGHNGGFGSSGGSQFA